MPEVAQSVVLTRAQRDSTAMPTGEGLEAFAATGATLVLHLAVRRTRELTARLAEHYGAETVSLNLSEVQNERGRKQNDERGLADKVTIVDGDFENIPYDDDTFDVVWSQDAMLHSGNRTRVLDEAVRVLKPGGVFIFTDPMMADDCPDGVLGPVLDRIQLETMGSPGFYRKELATRGLTERTFEDHTHQVPRHYGGIKKMLEARESELAGSAISDTYIANMKNGLQHWVDAGNAGHLAWGIMIFDNAQG